MNKDNNIIEFSRALEENKEAKIAYDKLKKPDHYDKDYKYSFEVHIKDCSSYGFGGISSTKILDLDNEDEAYFVNKYLPQLKLEMDKKIKRIMDEYKASGLNSNDNE